MDDRERTRGLFLEHAPEELLVAEHERTLSYSGAMEKPPEQCPVHRWPSQFTSLHRPVRRRSPYPRGSEHPGVKVRPGDQPLPVVNDSPSIQSMVIADLEQRTLVGIERYGTALQPFNGRDCLRDAYEEALDLATYLKQAIVERDNARG